MSHASRRGGGGGRRPKDIRRGPGHASPPPTRSTVKPGGVRRRSGSGSGSDPRLIAAVLGAAALIFAALFFGGVIGGGGSAGGSAGASASLPVGAVPRGSGCPTSQPAALPAGQTRTVTIKTAKGDITIKVEGALAPIAAGNFVALASCGFYDGLVFHRVVPDFVIQAGDPAGNGSGGPGYSFPDEPVTGGYSRGTVAMANSGPNTNGSQFFICVADLTTLPKSYTIFGHVTAGMDAADAIVAAAGGVEAPANPIAMTSVTVANP